MMMWTFLELPAPIEKKNHSYDSWDVIDSAGQA
jgi:hypothetical protein